MAENVLGAGITERLLGTFQAKFWPLKHEHVPISKITRSAAVPEKADRTRKSYTKCS